MPKGRFARVNGMIGVLFLGSFRALERPLRHLPIATMTHSGHPT